MPFSTFALVCNSSVLYYGPWNAILCTVSIAALPPAGTTVRLTPRVPALNPPVTTINGETLFTDAIGGTTISFVFQPALSYAFADGSSASLALAVADTSKMFAPWDLTHTFTCRALIGVILSREKPSEEIYVTSGGGGPTNPFGICVAVAQAPAAGETITVSLASSTMSVYSTGAPPTVLTFTASQSARQCVPYTSSIVGQRMVTLRVSGSLRFVAETSALSISVKELSTVTLTAALVGSSSTAGRSLVVFVGQSVSIGYMLTDAPPEGVSLSINVQLYCSFSPNPNTSTSLGGTLTFPSVSLTTDARAMTAAQPCADGELRADLTGTVTSFDLRLRPTLPLEIRPQKAISVSLSSGVIYGGHVDQRVLTITIEGAPYAAGSTLAFSITTVPAGLATLQFTSVEFSVGATVTTRTITVSTNQVAMTSSVRLNVTISGTAVSEYRLPATTEFALTILPIRIINFALDFSPAVIYVSPRLTKTMTVSLPITTSGDITVTPQFLFGSPSAVRFTPPSATLDGSHRSATFTVEALAATSSNEALTVSYAGTAAEFSPQPAAVSFPVRFVALGRVSLLEAVPTSIFQGLTATLFLQLSYPVPTDGGWSSVVVNVATNNPAITVSPASVSWAPGATTLQRQVVLTGASVASSVLLSFSLDPSTPPIYESQLPTSAAIEVLSTRAILWSVSTFVYVGRSVEGTLRIVQRPPAGARLAVAVQSSDVAAVSISAIADFDETTALSRTFTVSGQQARPGAVIYLSVGISVGLERYDQPATRTLEVRALETVTVTGIPVGGMYVGSSAVVSITLSRAPPCESGGTVSVVPVFGTSDARFTPTSGVQWVVGEAALTKTVLLTASQVTAAPVALSFPISYGSPVTCSGMYAPATLSVGSVRVYAKDVVKVSTWTNATDSNGVVFVYANNRIPLQIDLGTPAIRHSGVTLGISFAGGNAFVSFSSTVITLPAGVNSTTIWVTGLAEVTAADVIVTVAEANAFAFSPPPTNMRLRVVKQIAVTLRYEPLNPLLVVGVPVDIEVTIATSALIGSVTIGINYNNSAGNSSTNRNTLFSATEAVFEARTAFFTSLLTFTALRPTDGEAFPLRLSFSGPAAPFFYAVIPSYPTTLFAQRYVEIESVPSELFLGSANAKTLRVRLASRPTLAATDSITVALPTSLVVSYSPQQVILSNAVPEAIVTLTGVAPGAAILRDLWIVTSTSREYATRISNTAAASTVTVRALLTATMGQYLSAMFTEDSQTFTVSIPRVPLSGSLEVRPALLGTSYPLIVSPPSVVFTAATPLTASFTITASPATMPTATFQVTAMGSPEYASVIVAATLRVNPATQISVADFLPSVYIGSTNKFIFSIFVARRPQNGSTISVSFPTSPHFTFTPAMVEFGPADTHPLMVVPVAVQGFSVSNGPIRVPIALDDPTGWYDLPAAQSVSVLSLESYSGTIEAQELYQGTRTRVRLILSKVPVGPMTVQLTMMKNRSSTTMYNADPSLYAVSPSPTQTLSGGREVSFDITALAAPESIQVGFATSGASTSQFFIMTLPTFVVRFVPLLPIVATVPSYLYLGLPTQIQLSIPTAPVSGSLRLTLSPDPSIVFPFFNFEFTPTSPTVQNITVVANVRGSFTVGFSAQNIGTNAYMASVTPAQWFVNVEDPYPLDLIDPPAFVCAYPQNAITLRIDHGTLLAGETVSVSLTHNASLPSDVVVFPSTVEIPATAAVFTIYAVRPMYVRFNLTYISNARRLVLSQRLSTRGLVVNFRPLKVPVATLSVSTAVVGQPVPVSIVVSPSPSDGHTLFASLAYSGSPSNVELPPQALMWAAGADVAPRNIIFSGRSPTTIFERISVIFSGDPQYNLTSVSFEFKFNSLWRVTPTVPIIVYKDAPTPISFAIETTNPNNAAVLVITPSLSIIGSIKFMRDLFAPQEDTIDLAIKSKSSVAAYMVPAMESSRITISYALSADDAPYFSVPSPSTVQIVSSSTVIVDASSQNLIVYIAPSDEPAILVPVRVKIGVPPANGTLIVTPTLMCSSGQFVEFTPKAALFNASNPSGLQVNISIRGTSVSAPCDLGFALSGATAGFSGTPQNFKVETRQLHPITMAIESTRIFLGAENRVAINVSLDRLVAMPLADDITVTFTVDPAKAPCITVSPRVLFWARGVMESLSKIAFIEATCPFAANMISIDVKRPVIFSSSAVPKSVTVQSVNLLQVSVVDSSRPTSTDYFMYIGGAALDLDATITEPLAPHESLTVAPVFRGAIGSIDVAEALWLPSPLVSLSKKILLQPHGISPVAAISFAVTGPPRFNKTATGSGTLEIFGLKKVVAVLPDTLLVGQEYLARVTIETRPNPGETIVVQPVWEGQPDAISWTPATIVWTGSSSRTEEFFRITALQYSQPYNFVVRVSGSYRYVRTAYASTLTILRPQRIVSTQLPYELMRETQYAVGVDIGVLPAGASDTLYVRMTPELDEFGIECITLTQSELTFTRYVRNQLASTEQLVGVTVRRACPQRLIHFQILGSAISQYDRSIIPRAFVTMARASFAIDWPTDQYVGRENEREVVVSMLDTFFDELAYANVSIFCDSATLHYQQVLSWVYGSRPQIAFMLYNAVPEAVTCEFVVDSNTILGASIPPHTTVFNKFISVQRLPMQPTIYVGDSNKVKLSFNVSSLPLIIDGEPAAVFFLNARVRSAGLTVAPASLRWSADSPTVQFLYVVGNYPTGSPGVEIYFEVAGEGAGLVAGIPPPLVIEAIPLLFVDYSVPPSGLFQGYSNRRWINVTVPDTLDNISMTVGIEGEASGFVISPSQLNFAAGGRPWQAFTIEGLYPTSRVSYLKYTIDVGPPRITPRPTAAAESIYVIPLKPVSRTPAANSFLLFDQQTQIFTLEPTMPGLNCWSSDNSVVVTIANNDTLLVTPHRAATALINCSWPDTTFTPMVPFTVLARNRKTVSPPRKGSAYLGVSSGTRIPFAISAAPVGRMFVVEVNFNRTFVNVNPPQLSFTPTSATTQFFTVTGVSLTPTEGTLLTFSYSGEDTVHEYLEPKPEENSCAFRVVEKLVVTNCAGPSCVASSNLAGNRSIVGYIGSANNVRITFRAPQPTLYSDIRIWPDPISTAGGIVFCSQLGGGSCVPITQASPLLITTTISEVVALAFSFNPIADVPLVFGITGPQDYAYAGVQSMRAGYLTLKPLERVIVGIDSLRHELYVGSVNQQQVPITITAPPNVVGHNVEVATRAPSAIIASPQLITWTTTAAGMTTPLTQYVTFRGDETKLGKNYSITFGWRDRLSTTTAVNFQDAFSATSFYFDVLPLVAFAITVDGAAPTALQQYDVYLGEVNAKAITVVLERLPVFVTSEVTVRIVISNPDCFAASESQFRFSRLQNPELTRVVRVWAKQTYEGTNNTVTFQLIGTSEYRDMRHQIRLKGNALLQMKHDLTRDTIAVGTDNAISFLMWPPIPSDLTLGSLVTCGEVSFTATQLLKWENSMEPKRMTVAGSYPTTPASNCLLQTPVMGGLSATQFITPPLNIKMHTRARPRVLASPPDGIAGTAVRDNGISFVATLSEGGFWRWNTTHTSFESLIKSGTIRLYSTRDAIAEPNSIMSYYGRQMAGQMGNPFFIVTLDATENTLTFKMGPHPSFYASARETISIDFTRWSIDSGVSIDPAHSSIRFEVRGRKESLMGSSSDVLGSGAASAALAGGALSIGAATAAGKLQSIMNAFLCPNPDWRDQQDSMDWTDAPIPLSLASNEELGTYAGSALMNLVLIAMLLCVHLLVAYGVFLVRRRRSYRDKSFAAARAVVRFPSLMLFPILFLYQGIISASIKVVLYSGLAGLRVLCALLFIFVGFGVPALVFSMVGPGFTAIYKLRKDVEAEEDKAHAERDRERVREASAALDAEEDGEEGSPSKSQKRIGSGSAGTKKTAEEEAVEEPALPVYERKKPTGVQFVVRYLFQPAGRWQHEDPYWLSAYGMVFDEFQWRGSHRLEWFALVDVVITFVLGLADGIEPEDLPQCYGRLIVSVVAFFLQFFLIVIYRPYITRFLNAFFVFVYFLQFMSMLLVAIAVLNNTPQYDGVKIAVNLLLFFSCLLMVKSLIDIGMLVNEHFGISEIFIADDMGRSVGYRDLNAKEEDIVKAQVLQTLLKDASEAADRQMRGGGGGGGGSRDGGEEDEYEEAYGGDNDGGGFDLEEGLLPRHNGRFGGKGGFGDEEMKSFGGGSRFGAAERGGGPLSVKSDVIFAGGRLNRPPPPGTKERFEYERRIAAEAERQRQLAKGLQQQQQQQQRVPTGFLMRGATMDGDAGDDGDMGSAALLTAPVMGDGDDADAVNNNDDVIQMGTPDNTARASGGRYQRHQLRGAAHAHVGMPALSPTAPNANALSPHKYDDDSDDDDDYLYGDDDDDYSEYNGNRRRNAVGSGDSSEGYDPARYFGGKYGAPRNAAEAAEAQRRRAKGLVEADEGYRSVPVHLRQPRVTPHLQQFMAINKARREAAEEAARRALPAGASGRRPRDRWDGGNDGGGRQHYGQGYDYGGRRGGARNHRDDGDNDDFEL